MPRALEPRETEEGSQYRWLKGGLRLLGRSSATWMLAWLVWAVAALMFINDRAILALLLMGLSMMTFDLNLLAFDQIASARPRLSGVITQFIAHFAANARLYARAFIARMTLVTLMVMFMAGVMWALQEYAGATLPSSSPSKDILGIPWGLWTYAWFLPSLFQRGGVVSMRPWLMRRHGLSQDHASGLQALATVRNFNQVMSFQRWITLPSLACVLFFPIALPVLELLWVASVRCMYHDLFEGGLGIAEQKTQVETGQRQVVLLPVSR